MGLDTFASRSQDEVELSKEDMKAFEEANVELCGGILSGASSTFRGKIYDPVIWHLTGISLYRAWIPYGEVQEISQALERCDAERVARQLQGQGSRHRWSVAEIMELRKFFRVCRERGLGLLGWW
jgi:hypothetical protein